MKRQNVSAVEYIAHGVRGKFRGWEFCRMFAPSAFGGNLGRRDLAHFDGGQGEEMQLIKKFYWKFPEVKYMPISGPLKTLRGGSMRLTHPASVFVHK